MLDWFSMEKQVWFIVSALPILACTVSLLSHKMTMVLVRLPSRVVGWPPLLAWQAPIPRKAPVTAHKWVQDLILPLATQAQIYEIIGPEKLTRQIVKALRPRLDSLIDEAMDKNHAVLWENLPVTLKNRFYARAHRLLPRIIDDIIEDIGDNIDQLLSIPSLIEKRINQQPELMFEWLSHTSDQLANQIKYHALYLQLGASLITGFAYILFRDPMIILGGLVAGTMASYLIAKALIAAQWTQPYSPHNPTHQKKARHFLEFLCEEILTPYAIIDELLNGKKAKHTRLTIKKHVSRVLENLPVRTFAQLTIGPEGYVEIKIELSEKIKNVCLDPFRDQRFNQSRTKELSKQLFGKLQPNDEYFLPAVTEPYLTPLHHTLTTIGTLCAASCGMFLVFITL